MECSIYALIACFNWSGLYLDSGVNWQDAAVFETYRELSNVTLVVDGDMNVTLNSLERRSHRSDNPYGRLAVGYEFGGDSLQFRLELSHMSSLSTGKDRGTNAVGLSARWYPFRH